MAPSDIRIGRFSPYKNFRFRVIFDGRYVAGFAKMGPLSRPLDPGIKSGRVKYDPVSLDRGVTHDPAFEAWIRACLLPGDPDTVADIRRDIIIDVFNEAGEVAMSYRLMKCQASGYTALPDPDASANAVAIGHLQIRYEDWEPGKDPA